MATTIGGPPRTTAPPAMPSNLAVLVPVIVGGLCGWLGVQQLLLWRFLGLSSAWCWCGGLLLAILAAGVIRFGREDRPTEGARIGLPLIGGCLAIALVVFVLGGEGRFVYANTDWQVRGAVLRDLTVHPWPFAYGAGPAPQILRAPTAMYLTPALVGKVLGYRAAELALLFQNSAMLAALLALGATLYRGARARGLALLVFLGFSGMDLLGEWIVSGPLDGHLENWSGLQYSSHVTQAFWVPQHALAGWTGALLYLLCREGRLSRAAFLTPLPLLALWSPLALIGVLPFAAHAGLDALARRRIAAADVLLPALATVVAAPSLLYLATASGTVGGHVARLDLLHYVAFELVEVVPYLLAAELVARRQRFGGIMLALVALVLLLAPWARIGDSIDLVMRASIPALLILSLSMADVLIAPATDARARIARRIIAVTFIIGLATPLSEIARAFRYPRAPAGLCSYLGVVPDGSPDYVAPLAAVPAPIRPARPAIVRPRDPAACWDGPWPMPPGGAR